MNNEEAGTVTKPEFNATFEAVTTGARSIPICVVLEMLDVPSLIHFGTLRFDGAQ